MIPEKRIADRADLVRFCESRQFAEIWAFVLRLNDAVRGKKRSAISRPNLAPTVRAFIGVLEGVAAWIHDIEPEAQPARFGNKAFRTWHARLVEEAVSLMAQVIAARRRADDADARPEDGALAAELAAYFATSFGNETRIDYGSGHEATFAILLFCMEKAEIFTQDDYLGIVFGVFPAYLSATRSLQKTYRLEPAGSHGVWGLDDYSFLPFLWGSSQLVGTTRIAAPSAVDDNRVIREHRAEYLYLDAIAYIKEVKTGPFHEHSPMLYDISRVKQGWRKINQGMIKMYRAEVWSKLPVVQHILFGELFPFPPAKVGDP